MQLYHTKCSLRVRILRKLGIIKRMPRFRVVGQIPELDMIDYRCDCCGTLLSIDTDWDDPDLKVDFVTVTQRRNGTGT